MTKRTPYTYTIEADTMGKTIAAVIKGIYPDMSWAQVRRLISDGEVKLGTRYAHSDTERVKNGDTIIVFPEKKKKQTKRNIDMPKIKIVHFDSHVVVIEKPVGLTTIRHPQEVEEYGEKARFLPTSLAQILPQRIFEYTGQKMRKGTLPPVKAVHRLDKETSGLMVFARTDKAASVLGQQFKAHTITRRYRAVVVGTAYDRRIVSLLSRDRGDGLRGSNPTQGKEAITNIKVLDVLPGYSVIECRLETGRTHQIRIHTMEQGNPICGEKVYIRPFKRKTIADGSKANRLMLHATVLGFIHPTTSKYMEFTSSLPPVMSAFIKRLKRDVEV